MFGRLSSMVKYNSIWPTHTKYRFTFSIYLVNCNSLYHYYFFVSHFSSWKNCQTVSKKAKKVSLNFKKAQHMLGFCYLLYFFLAFLPLFKFAPLYVEVKEWQLGHNNYKFSKELLVLFSSIWWIYKLIGSSFHLVIPHFSHLYSL